MTGKVSDNYPNGQKRRAADIFDAHLNGCRQCREPPFSLCAQGAKLIEQSLREADDAVNAALSDAWATFNRER